MLFQESREFLLSELGVRLRTVIVLVELAAVGTQLRLVATLTIIVWTLLPSLSRVGGAPSLVGVAGVRCTSWWPSSGVDTDPTVGSTSAGRAAS